MKQIVRIAFIVFALLTQSLVYAEWMDITSQVNVIKTPQAFDRVNRTIFSLITLHNTSSATIVGPLRIRVFNPSIPFKQTAGSDNDTILIEIPDGIEADETITKRIDFQLFKNQLEYSVILEEESRFKASEFSLLFGGTGTDYINATEVDSQGDIIVAGTTTSPSIGAVMHYFTNHQGNNVPDAGGDAFVAKMSQDGNIIWATYIGGDSSDNIIDLVLDDSGNIYATGSTYSDNYPTTENAFQKQMQSGRAAFVTVLSSDGEQLIYSSLITGHSWNYGFAVDIDRVGDIYIAGFTHGGFPITDNAAQQTFGGYGDGFVAKLRPNQLSTELVFSTYLGGNRWEGIAAIAVDDMGDIYIATHSQSSNFPTTPGAYDETCTHCEANRKTDGVIAKLSADGSRFLYSTIIGSNTFSGTLAFTGIAITEDHSVFAIGNTNYTDLPITDNAYQPTFGGGNNDFYLVHLNAEGNQLLSATYLGADGDDNVAIYSSLKRDNSGRLYFAGSTSSNNFPMINPLQYNIKGNRDVIVIVYNPKTDKIDFSSYLGGTLYEAYDVGNPASIAIGQNGIFYLTGSTASTDFPVFHNSSTSTYHGGSNDGFITRIDINQQH